MMKQTQLYLLVRKMYYDSYEKNGDNDIIIGLKVVMN